MEECCNLCISDECDCCNLCINTECKCCVGNNHGGCLDGMYYICCCIELDNNYIDNK